MVTDNSFPRIVLGFGIYLSLKVTGIVFIVYAGIHVCLFIYKMQVECFYSWLMLQPCYVGSVRK